MRLKARLLIVGILLIVGSAQAAERTFKVFDTKRITNLVERFYGSDGTAFATLFCDEKSFQVMIVDSRLRDLDGKVFYFTGPEACELARNQARQFRSQCLVELVVDQDKFTAKTQVSNCK